MSRILILICSLIFLLILIGSLGIYIINKNSPPPQNTQALTDPHLPLVDIQPNKRGFWAELNIVSIKKSGDKLLATVSSPAIPSVKYNVTLFDKEIYPNLFFDLPPNPETPQVDSITLRGADSALAKINIYKGRTLLALIPLKGPPDDKPTLDCNENFSKSLKGGKEFSDCLPLIIQLSANAQNL